MLNFRLPERSGAPYNLLCLGSHCDDIEIGCGGTVLHLLDRYPNASVYWVVFSSDRQRAAEARAAAGVFLKSAKSKKVLIKTYRDAFFPALGKRIKEDFEKLKQEFKPDVVFTHCRHDLHQDHRTICELTWNTFRNHLILEYEIPKYDGDLGSPNFFVPLEESICRQKIDAVVRSFVSQQQKHWFEEQTFFATLRLRGLECASPTRYAEAFYCRKLVLA
jgi:LmbE family N-acetylglucosaminyl deacetylase